jgi:hypothetical protein
MKFDPFTLTVLSNFSGINNDIVINVGSEIRTMSDNSTLMAEATVPNSFDKTFGIYDLRKLLGCFSLLKDPDVILTDTHLEISSNNTTIKYFYTNPSRLVTPTKRLNINNAVVHFNLPKTVLADISKTSQVLSVEDLVITNTKDNVNIEVVDRANKTSNSAAFSVEGIFKKKFEAIIKIGYIKLIPDDYEVKLTPTGIAYFKSKNYDLKYYVAMESDSEFEE